MAISHAQCDHPNTAAARAKCRANQQTVADGKVVGKKKAASVVEKQVALTRSYRETLLGVAGTTVAEVKKKLGLSEADLADIDLWFEREMPGLVKIVKTNHKNAAMLTTRYLRQHAALEGFQVGAVPAQVIEEQLVKSLTVTGPGAFKKHIAGGGTEAEALAVMKTTLPGSAERLAMMGARETLTGAVENLESPVLGYTRRTSGSPCSYCSGLSRDPVYAGEDGVKTFHAHDHCTCTGEPFYLDGGVKVKSTWVEPRTEAGRDLQNYAQRTATDWFNKGRSNKLKVTWDQYQMSRYYQVQNGALRSGDKELLKQWQEIAEVAGVEADEDALLYRGILPNPRFNWRSELVPGRVFTEDGVMSTTSSSKNARGWLSDFMDSVEAPQDAMLMEIRTKSGSRVIGGYDNSFETMIPPKTKFRVIKIEEREIAPYPGKVPVVIVEMI